MKSQKLDVNASLQIFCAVQQGVQPFFFDWSKNGQPIRSGPGNRWEIENTKKISTLIIERIDKQDAGNYSCLVKNKHGSDSTNFEVNVKGMLKFKYGE